VVQRQQELDGYPPHCDIEAVIDNASGYPIMPGLLAQMKARWSGKD